MVQSLSTTQGGRSLGVVDPAWAALLASPCCNLRVNKLHRLRLISFQLLLQGEKKCTFEGVWSEGDLVDLRTRVCVCPGVDLVDLRMCVCVLG